MQRTISKKAGDIGQTLTIQFPVLVWCDRVMYSAELVTEIYREIQGEPIPHSSIVMWETTYTSILSRNRSDGRRTISCDG